MKGKGDMIKAFISLQDLRRRIYVKAKAEPSWRFWGLYVHVCKMETLLMAYKMAKKNNGAPGTDGVTFKDIEAQGVVTFLEQIQNELIGSRSGASKRRRPCLQLIDEFLSICLELFYPANRHTGVVPSIV